MNTIKAIARERYTAKEAIGDAHGFATLQGKRYLLVGKTWKPGDEAIRCEPNGEYDWIMGEQKGRLTPHMTFGGGRCHDE